MNLFNPPDYLKNHHLQSVLASIKIRKSWIQRNAHDFLSETRPLLLDCGSGVRLQGFISGTAERKRIAVVIHGWEGSAESSYLFSAAVHLYNRGFRVLRLNLRDHGDTHHLNTELFHSCRIDEVVSAVRQVQDMFSHERLFLGGFSLGGNFALRVGLRANAVGVCLDRIAAVCPVLEPEQTLYALENGWFVYNRYFIRKWKRSLKKKFRLFPQLGQWQTVAPMNSLLGITEYFAPIHTGFPTARDYFKGYAITGDVLRPLQVPSWILAAQDDPVIPADGLSKIARPDALTLHVTRFGGHCGYIQNSRLVSFADQWMAAVFEGTVADLQEEAK